MPPSGAVDAEPLVEIERFLMSWVDDLPLRTEELSGFASALGGVTARLRVTRGWNHDNAWSWLLLRSSLSQVAQCTPHQLLMSSTYGVLVMFLGPARVDKLIARALQHLLHQRLSPSTVRHMMPRSPHEYFTLKASRQPLQRTPDKRPRSSTLIQQQLWRSTPSPRLVSASRGAPSLLPEHIAPSFAFYATVSNGIEYMMPALVECTSRAPLVQHMALALAVISPHWRLRPSRCSSSHR